MRNQVILINISRVLSKFTIFQKYISIFGVSVNADRTLPVNASADDKLRTTD